CKPAFVASGEMGQVGVGDLSVADYAVHLDLVIGDIIGPEVMMGAGGERLQDGPCGPRRLAFSKEQADQSAFCDRTGRKALGSAGEPGLRGRMVDVVDDNQGDE